MDNETLEKLVKLVLEQNSNIRKNIDEEFVGTANIALPTFPMSNTIQKRSELDKNSDEYKIQNKLYNIKKEYPVIYNNYSALIQEDTKNVYEYSSLQYVFSEYHNQLIRQFRETLIDYNDVIEYEDNTHLTIKYGLFDKFPNNIFNFLNDNGYNNFFPIYIGETEVFEGEETDCVVLRCYSEELNKLHTVIKNNFNNIQTYPDYKAHITLAYIKKGCKHKYHNQYFSGLTMLYPINIEFSSKNGCLTKLL